MSLQYLLDKHAIEQVYIRYCELVDSKQFDRTAADWRVCRRVYTCFLSEGPAGVTSKQVAAAGGNA